MASSFLGATVVLTVTFGLSMQMGVAASREDCLAISASTGGIATGGRPTPLVAQRYLTRPMMRNLRE